MTPGPIERQSLHAEVADRVRTRIVGRELEPSSRIDETALCAALGISRTPLREALKVLASEGWVSLVPGKGAFVTAIGPQDIDALFPVMALLEGRCACDAVRRLTAADARRLGVLHERLERLAAAGDIDGYYAVNADFHRAIEALAGNPWLIRVTSELRSFLLMSRGRQLQVPGRLQASLREHRRLMDAIDRRDPAAAERVMRAHLLAQRRAWRRLHAASFEAPAGAAPRVLSAAHPSVGSSPSGRGRGTARRRSTPTA
ncbi:MAG: GntR family transcriptional regulator [Burkholderiaceae bacterium]